MLKAMRKNVKKLKPSLWLVVAAFIIAIFAVWGGGGRLEIGGEKPLIIVGEKKIYSQDYILALRRQIESWQSQVKGLNRNLIEQLGLPQRVLQELIQQNLLLEIAKDLRIEVTDEEVRDRIMSLPVFQREGRFIGFEEYRRILELNRMSVTEFEASLKQDLLLSKVAQLLTANAIVREIDAWENYKKNNDKARLEYLVMEKNKVNLEAIPTSEDLQSFFAKNQARYELPEKRQGYLIFLPLSELKKEIAINEAEIEKYYEDNKEQFREPESIRVSRIYLPFTAENKEAILNQAKSLLDRLKQGEDFAALAREFSKDDKAAQGGDWGEWEWRQLSPDEQRQIEKLEKNQDIMVELAEGVSLLRVTERRESRIRPLTEVRNQIKSSLEDQKAREIGINRLNRLRKEAKKEKSLEIAASKLGYKGEIFGPIKEGEAIADKDQAGFISKALFNLKEKEMSEVIQTFDGLAICELTKILPAHQATLDEVRSEVEKDWLEAKKKEKAREKLEQLRPILEKSSDWEKIAKENNLEFKTVNEHKRDQYLSLIGDSQPYDELIFSLPLSQVSEPVEYDGGYAIFRVLERKEASRDDFLKNLKEEMNNLLTVKRNLLLSSFLSKFQEEKKVKLNTQEIQKINNEILARFER
ncbi:MAG: SurA N-terminal domain-containing protein [Candidatus Aminicenantes bacterium]|nr:SurA N-terminal domain-containing protein [Candidatus Aminicenantes bacterium]